MDPAYMGYIFLIPIMYMFMNMMDSFNQYKVKETCDVYLLCERVGDLENAFSVLTKLVERVKDLDKEYVEALRYNKDHLELKDSITINRNDIVRLEDKISKQLDASVARQVSPRLIKKKMKKPD